MRSQRRRVARGSRLSRSGPVQVDAVVGVETREDDGRWATQTDLRSEDRIKRPEKKTLGQPSNRSAGEP